MEKATQQDNPRAFRKGLREIKVKDQAAVRHGVMAILGAKNISSFYFYSFGREQVLDVEVAKKIEQLFASYGVADCWGL